LRQNKKQDATASAILQTFSNHPTKPFPSPVTSSIVFMLQITRLQSKRRLM